MHSFKPLHPLFDYTKPHVLLRFVQADGTVASFSSGINSLTGDRMSWFNDAPPSIGDSLKWVNSVVRDILAKCTVTHREGNM